MPEPRVQLRCEDGGLYYYDLIAEAMAHAERDSSAWKISWSDPVTGERIRLVREFKAWIYEPIELPTKADLRRLSDGR